MDVGLYFDLRNPPAWRKPWPVVYQQALETAAEADRLGIASLWFSEHHFFEDGYLPQPLTFAAAVAARTKRARIGTAVLLLALRPAILVAEEAAVVDAVSDGRLDLGIGAGYRKPEFEAYGADITNRYQLVERRVHELREWWSGAALPPPANGTIPLWGGFFGPRGAQLAGRLGMGLLAADAALLEAYLTGLAEGGTGAEARLRVNVDVVLADDPEATWSRIAPHVAYQWNSYRRYMNDGTHRPPPPPVRAEDLRTRRRGESMPRFEVLTPDEAASAIRSRYQGLPVDQVYIWERIAGMPDDIAGRHVELVCGPLAALLRAP